MPTAFRGVIADALTGADGYHYFRIRLGEELDRARRYARPVALVLLDVDDLRGINDRAGRAAGDLVLQQVTILVAQAARSVDRVGRWCGGAVALLLPETDASMAEAIAERLRRVVEGHRYPVRAGAVLDATVSCGVAAVDPARLLEVETLVERADVALGRAKASGRNRTVKSG